MGALEATMLASVNKKGAASFTLPGLLKITALQVPAKKKRVGIDPFTKQERTFGRQAGHREAEGPFAEEAEGRGPVIVLR